MSDALAKVLRRFEERLVKLESEAEARARHWKAVHLHKALEVLPDTVETGSWAVWTEAVKAKTGAKGNKKNDDNDDYDNCLIISFLVSL